MNPNKALNNAIFAKINNAITDPSINEYRGVMFYRADKNHSNTNQFNLSFVGKTIALTNEQIEFISNYLQISSPFEYERSVKPSQDTPPLPQATYLANDSDTISVSIESTQLKPATKQKYIPASDAYDNYKSSFSDDDECPFKEPR